MVKEGEKMKRVISIALICVILLSVMALCSCNKNIGIGTYKFKKVHIFIEYGYGTCFDISSWREADVGVEVKVDGYGSLWLSEGTYMLVGDKCPICNR